MKSVKRKRLPEAEREVRSALERLPDDQRLHLQLAYWLDRDGRRTEASAVLGRLPAGDRDRSSHRLRYTEHASSLVTPLRRELATNTSVRLPRLGAALAVASGSGK